MNRRLGIGLLVIVWLTLGVFSVSAQEGALTLTVAWQHLSNAFDEGAAEIVAFHAPSATLFVTNGNDKTIDLIDLSDPANPVVRAQIDISELGDGPTHVDVFGDIVAGTVCGRSDSRNRGVWPSSRRTARWSAASPLARCQTCSFSRRMAARCWVANEGEPSDDYLVDPEGTVSIIDISGGIEGLTDDAVTTMSFADIAADSLDPMVRVYGPGATSGDGLRAGIHRGIAGQHDGLCHAAGEQRGRRN